MPRRLLSQISAKLGRSSLDDRPGTPATPAPDASLSSKSGDKRSGAALTATEQTSMDAKMAEVESRLVEAERCLSFAEEKEQQADERVAAAEARARKAEEQLMSIAATLRVPRDKLVEAVKPDSRAMQRARSAGPRGRSGGGRGKSQPEGARLLHLGEPAAEQQSDSSWSFPARDDSWDFKSDGLDGWETRSGSSRGRSQDLDSTLPSPERLPSVGEAAHRVDTAAADKRIFTKGDERRAKSLDLWQRRKLIEQDSDVAEEAADEDTAPSTAATLQRISPFASRQHDH